MLAKSEEFFFISEFFFFFLILLKFGAFLLVYIISHAASLKESGGYINI